MLKFFRVPFAVSGTRAPVPDAADPSGFVSYIEGYGVDYQRAKADPLSKNIERDKMNEVFFDITNAIAELQSKGAPDFITSALNGGTPYSYAINAIVRYSDDNVYMSLVAANTALPTDPTKWAPIATLASFVAPDGSSKVGFIQPGSEARSRTLQSKGRDTVNLIEYQDTGDADPAGLNQALDLADSTAGREILVGDDFSVNGTLVNGKTTQAPWRGEGSVAGPYRKWVTPYRRAPFVPVNSIVARKHLKMLGTTDSPVVAIMGDSISTEGPDTFSHTANMWSILKEKFARDNPEKAFTFHNRAIGGQTWLNANTTPTAFPYWYTTPATPWLDYLQALNPDVIVLAFGMNDSNGFNAGALVAVVNKILAWTKVPDIVFVTTPVPAQAAVYPDGNGFGFRGQTFQEGRDYAAGFSRTYAEKFGYGVIDVNRTMVARRDGYDTTSGPLREIASGIVTPAYSAATGAVDFSFHGAASGASWTEGRVLSFKCGLGADDFVFVTKTGGNFVFSGFTGSLSTYASVATGVAIPAGAFSLEVSVIGNIARLLIDPSSSTFAEKRVIAEFPVVRHGGQFLPVTEWQATPGSGPWTNFGYGSSYGMTEFQQVCTDQDIWNVSDNTPDIKPVFGGNGINHYSSLGLEMVVRPTIEACDFGGPGYLTGIAFGGRWTKFADGTSIFQKKTTLSAVPMTAGSGSIFLQNTPVADTDFPPIFMSDGASGFVFTATLDVMATASQFVGVVANGVSLLRNAVRYRLWSPTSIASANVDVYISMVGRWK